MPLLQTANPESIALATERLRAGRLVAFPTETVYGLGAGTLNPAAIARVYEAKGRPSDNPLIAHVLSIIDAKRLCTTWPVTAADLTAAFWPGPLTIILPRASSVPAEATGGRDTIALRSPRHPVARQLLESFRDPISAPSANRSGRVSPTTAQHVAADFHDLDDLLILDGGPCELGLESTVVDLTSPTPRLLRPGSITPQQLRHIVGDIDSDRIAAQTHSPGTSHRHYAPRTPLLLLSGSEIETRLRSSTQPLAAILIQPISLPTPNHRIIAIPHAAADYAHSLYAALREADAAGASQILIERPPADSADWLAIHDRLSRASSL